MSSANTPIVSEQPPPDSQDKLNKRVLFKKVKPRPNRDNKATSEETKIDDSRVKKEDLSDDSGDDEKSFALQAAIVSTKRKRHLTRERQFRKDKRASVDDASITRKGASLTTERLTANFAGGSSGTGPSSTSDILGHKHEQAMQEFIAQNMSSLAKNGRDDNDISSSQQEQDSSCKTAAKDVAQLEKQLYAELAASSLPTINSQTVEGDVGAGGAMLGGTGIAEVSLPIDERIRNIQETEQAAAARNTQFLHNRTAIRKEDAPMLPSQFGAGPGKSSRIRTVQEGYYAPAAVTTGEEMAEYHPSASSAGVNVRREDVSHLGASYAHNFRLHTHLWVSTKKEERDAELEAHQKRQEMEQGTHINRERIGFDAVRGRTTDNRGKEQQHPQQQQHPQRSNDDRTWKSFMTRQRDRGGRR